MTMREAIKAVRDEYRSNHIIRAQDVYSAIAAAEAKQVEPVRLTNADIVGLIQAWNATDFSGVVDLILSVESAVLRRNGINPQAKGG